MAVGEAAHPLAGLVGEPLPGGRWSAAAYESWLTSYAVYGEPGGPPHPVSAFIGVQRGLGLTVAELFAHLGSSIEDGPMLAECTMEFPGVVRDDQVYEVSGTVQEVRRKSGRTMGVFDLVTCRFELSSDEGPVAAVTNVYAVPRPGEAS